MDMVTCVWAWLSLLTVYVGESQGHGTHHGAGIGGAPADRPTGFHDPKVVHDTEHIKEHYEGQAKIDEAAMTPEELEFHYFKLHDYDNNTQLDGLEILKALTHLVPYEPNEEQGEKGGTVAEKSKQQKEEELRYYMEIVDTVLEEDDIDNDGYLTYAEYVLARKREEAKRDSEKAQEQKRTRH